MVSSNLQQEQFLVMATSKASPHAWASREGREERDAISLHPRHRGVVVLGADRKTVCRVRGTGGLALVGWHSEML